MNKALKVTKEAYDALVELKRLLTDKYSKEGDLENSHLIKSMGLGSFAGWIIFKQAKKLEEENHD